MTRLDFQHLCGYTPTTANRRLKELLDRHKLCNMGFKRAPIYEAAAGYYGKRLFDKRITRFIQTYRATIRWKGETCDIN